MDLIQRELTKLATAAVIVDEVVKAAQTQDGMAKEAKMKPGLIALLAALGLAGAGAGAYAGGAFDREKLPRPDDIRKGNRGGTLTPLRHAMARAMRPTPVESAESLRAKAEAEKASNPYNPPVKPNRGIAEMQRRYAEEAERIRAQADAMAGRIRAQADAIRARREADAALQAARREAAEALRNARMELRRETELTPNGSSTAEMQRQADAIRARREADAALRAARREAAGALRNARMELSSSALFSI